MERVNHMSACHGRHREKYVNHCKKLTLWLLSFHERAARVTPAWPKEFPTPSRPIHFTHLFVLNAQGESNYLKVRNRHSDGLSIQLPSCDDIV